jgi:hypothetical protein
MLGVGVLDLSSLGPTQLLNSARRAVPAVDYAIGAAGVAVAGALIVSFGGGNWKSAFIILGATLVAMLLLFAFARLVHAPGKSVSLAATVMLWSATITFCGLMVLIPTTIVLRWPPSLMDFFAIKPFASRDFIIGKWHAKQNQGNVTWDLTMEYRDDGTCLAAISIVENGRSLEVNEPPCRWTFDRISDSEYRLTRQSPESRLDGRSEYEILGPNRVRHIRGVGGDFVVERIGK